MGLAWYLAVVFFPFGAGVSPWPGISRSNTRRPKPNVQSMRRNRGRKVNEYKGKASPCKTRFYGGDV